MLDLSLIDANSETANDDAFNFVGTSEFSNAAGELRYSVAPGGYVILRGDVDGDGVADIEIKMDEMAFLDVTDIVL